MVLAADKPMPEWECLAEKTFQSGPAAISGTFGLIITPGSLDLIECGCSTGKRYFYDLVLQADRQCLNALREYLYDRLIPSDEVELWGIWEGMRVGEQGKLVFAEDYAQSNRTPICRTVSLKQLELDTLSLLVDGHGADSVRITVQRDKE